MSLCSLVISMNSLLFTAILNKSPIQCIDLNAVLHQNNNNNKTLARSFSALFLYIFLRRKAKIFASSSEGISNSCSLTASHEISEQYRCYPFSCIFMFIRCLANGLLGNRCWQSGFVFSSNREIMVTTVNCLENIQYLIPKLLRSCQFRSGFHIPSWPPSRLSKCYVLWFLIFVSIKIAFIRRKFNV